MNRQSISILSFSLFISIQFSYSYSSQVVPSHQSIKRFKRAAYDLPAGVEEQLGITDLKKTFMCDMKGYFADVDNDCKIFHVCHAPEGNNNPMAITQNSMACGLNQRFDQSKLTCNHENDAIPCTSSPEFFYLNERIGDMNADFLGPADIDKAKNARPEYRAAAAARAARAARAYRYARHAIAARLSEVIKSSKATKKTKSPKKGKSAKKGKSGKKSKSSKSAKSSKAKKA